MTKLFEQHEAQRKAAEAANKRYEDSIKGISKSREPDNQGTLSKQNAPIRPEAKKK